MSSKIMTFLMFNGRAEEAINYYCTLFEHSEIKKIIRYKKDEAGEEGTVMHAVILLLGQDFMFIDSAAKHDFTFNPSISIWINCDSEKEINSYFNELSKEGKVFMQLGSYGYSKKYCWIEDKFGVSWQLNFN